MVIAAQPAASLYYTSLRLRRSRFRRARPGRGTTGQLPAISAETPLPRSWLVRAGNDLLMMDGLSSARTSQDRGRLGFGTPGSQSVMPPSGQARRWAPGNEGDV